MMSNENVELAKRDYEDGLIKFTKHDIVSFKSMDKHIESCKKAKAKRKRKKRVYRKHKNYAR